MLIDGKYVPSRFQGNLPSEIVLGFFASLFGPIGSNSVSLVASLSALGMAGILLNRSDERDSAGHAARNPVSIVADRSSQAHHGCASVQVGLKLSDEFTTRLWRHCTIKPNPTNMYERLYGPALRRSLCSTDGWGA